MRPATKIVADRIHHLAEHISPSAVLHNPVTPNMVCFLYLCVEIGGERGGCRLDCCAYTWHYIPLLLLPTQTLCISNLQVAGQNESPVRVLITGAAGQIAYSLVFLIAGGHMLGRRPVILHLFDLPEMVPAMKGVAMELEDCAYPLLHGTSLSLSLSLVTIPLET